MPTEQQLSDVLSEFARTMVTDFPIQAIPDHLVVRIVDVLPISGAGVTLIEPGSDPRYVAASDDVALRFEELQTDVAEGPCLVAYETGEAVVVADLRDDLQFPKFGPQAVAAGLVAVLTFPLRQGEKRLGALDLYRTAPGAMDAGDMSAAQTLADVAAAYISNAQARAELRDASDRYRERSLHDPLTGLPNRVLFGERVDHAVHRAGRSHNLVALLLADLDRFKEVNDVHGHQTGDELLIEVADRLTALIRPGDTLARLSGDEFVVLCEDLAERAQVEPLAARIGAALAEPFVLSGIELRVTASVGVAFAGRGDDVSEKLLRDADIAMYQAKRRGGGRHQIADTREQRFSQRRSSLEKDLLGAVGRGELRLDYQPIVATTGGRITGVEALLRWDHPSLGSLPPETIVPLAEQAGLIREVGRWVVERACLDRNLWCGSHGRGDLGMFLNVSGEQVMSPDFTEELAALLVETRTEPGSVTLEVTEGVLVDDPGRALVVLDGLKRMGVSLALDRFGTGYSSFGYLERFPLDMVKIDRGVVAKLVGNPAGPVLVSAVVGMARVLGMTVVAGGVETAEQRRAVETLGCDRSQGFYFSHPMAADEIQKLL